MSKKIILYAILFLVIPMYTLTSAGNIFYKKNIMERTNDMSQQNLELISTNISTLINNIIAASNIISNDPEICDILFQGDTSYENRRILEKKIIAAQSSVLYPYNTNMVLYDLNQHYYSASISTSYQDMQKVINESWYQETLALNGIMNWCYPNDEIINFDNYTPNNICMARMLKTQNGKGCGILLIYVNLDTLRDSIFPNSDSEYSGTFYLADKEGRILISSATQPADYAYKNLNLSSKHYKEGRYIIEDEQGSHIIVHFGPQLKGYFQIFHIIQEELLLAEVNSFQTSMTYITIFFLLLFIILTIIFARIVTRPLTDMCISMQMISDSDFSHKVRVHGKDEISTVAQHYNTMIDEVQRLLGELQQAHYQREELRYKALQNQINPHFILNTLNVIKLLVQMGNSENASKIIVEFGKMLEHILNRNDEMVSLKDELQYIESYCTLQRMRYGNNFTLKINCDEKVTDFKVPSLLLQPLVENAIIHGISTIQELGEISISAFSENNFIYIKICDNGIGISDSQIKELLTTPSNSKVTGIGVRNVLERIHLVYGSDSGLTISCEETGGTTILIFLKEIRGNQLNDTHNNCR